jgi:pimeloyl-ACP methyl ester carboxylesterase
VDAVAVDGHQIAFIQAGQGLPVILLGGFVGDAVATWHHQIEALSDTNAVLAWDAPGSGGSSDVPESFRLPDYADCLADWCRCWSWSAWLSSDCRSAVLWRWSSSDAVMVWCAGCFWPAPMPDGPDRCRRTWSGRDSNPVLRPHSCRPRSSRRHCCRACSRLHLDRVEEFAAGVVRAFRPAGFRTMAAASAEADLRDVLPQVDVPTVVLHASHDVRSPRYVAEALHAAIPNSRMVELSGAGHVSCVEAPELFTAEVRTFLRRFGRG